MKLRFIFGIIISTLLLGCNNEPVQDIPLVFQEYVDLFFEEGQKRGFTTALTEIDLSIEFGDLSERDAAGICTFSSNEIVIDQNYWEIANYEKRRNTIFHELGHCVLDRQHRNESNSNDQCYSIMKANIDGFNCSTDIYSNKWFDHYLDELFDPSLDWPMWYSKYADYTSSEVESIILESSELTNQVSIDSVNLKELGNFRIEIEANSDDLETGFLKVYLGNIGFAQCNECTGTNVRISNGLNVHYHNYDGSIRFENALKLTINKIDDDLYFYVNERFVHTFEVDIWNFENEVETTYFEDKANVKIRIQTLKE